MDIKHAEELFDKLSNKIMNKKQLIEEQNKAKPRKNLYMNLKTKKELLNDKNKILILIKELNLEDNYSSFIEELYNGYNKELESKQSEENIKPKL